LPRARARGVVPGAVRVRGVPRRRVPPAGGGRALSRSHAPARAGVPLRALRRRDGVRRIARALPVVLDRGSGRMSGGDPIAQHGDLMRTLEGAVDAAIIVDQEHRVLYRNPAYDAYTGRRPREVASLAEAARRATRCSTS